MIRRIRPIALATAAAAAALLALSGCEISVPSSSGADTGTVSTNDTGTDTDTEAGTTTDADAGADAGADGDQGDKSDGAAAMGSVKDAGDIPDPCTLLTEAQVRQLTSQGISQVDEDGGKPGDTSRYCQWQLDAGQLAVFLSRTSEAEFAIKSAEAEPVGGIGQDAYLLSGHLLVLYGTVSIDVYARGGSDAENLQVMVQTVGTLLPKI